MPGPEAFDAAAGVGAVIVFIAAVALALRRLGLFGAAAAQKAAERNAQDVDALEKDIAALRLHVAETCVHRDDYVANQSRIIGMLENHSAMLVRLEERMEVRR